MNECNWLRHRQRERIVLDAFKQACAEAGIPEHPAGDCPTPGCRCEELGDQVEARAIQIIEAKLGPLPEVTT
jgi:hypothetical protein